MCTAGDSRSGDPSELEKAPLVITAAVTGALTGVTVALFKLSIANFASAIYSGDESMIPSDQRLFIPALGGLIVGVIRLLSPQPNIGPGLAEHVVQVERSVPLRTEASVARGVAAVATLGTGNSLGPEGPSVELGVTISRLVSGWVSAGTLTQQSSAASLRVKRELVATGAAAGVAAGFNAPLAGVFFALEVVCSAARSAVQADSANSSATELKYSAVGNSNPAPLFSIADRTELDIKSKEAISGISVSALIAAAVVQEILGNELALRPGLFEVKSPVVELPLSAGLGVLAGALALLFEKSTSISRTTFRGVLVKSEDDEGGGLDPRIAEAVRPVLGGLACGLVGVAFPQILFFGYATLDDILATGAAPTAEEASKVLSGVSPSGLSGADLVTISDQLALLAAKLIATSICVGSGLVGGTFAPSIFLGAVLGVAYQTGAGSALQSLATVIADFQSSIGVPVGSWGVIPQLTVADSPAYAILGAAAMLASVFRAPLTAALLMFELTRDYQLILPLLAAAGIGPLVVELYRDRATPSKEDAINKNSMVPEECDVDNKIVCEPEEDSPA